LVVPAEASRQDDVAAAQAGLIELDELLATRQLDLAVAVGRLLVKRFEKDPVYLDQIEGRLGLALFWNGELEEALAVFQSAIRNNPQEPNHHRNLAAVLMTQGRKGRALTELQQVVELTPGDFGARLDLGQALLEFRAYGDAREHLETARLLCEDCLEVQTALARLYLALRDYDAAVAALLRLRETDRSPEIRRSLIAALVGAGRDAELMALWEQQDLADLPADELRLLVEAEGRLGNPRHSLDWAEALPLPATGSATSPAVPPAVETDALFWGRISLNLLEARKENQALAAVRHAISIEPDNVVYVNNEVVLLKRLGRVEEAEQRWQRVLELDPTRAEQERE